MKTEKPIGHLTEIEKSRKRLKDVEKDLRQYNHEELSEELKRRLRNIENGDPVCQK